MALASLSLKSLLFSPHFTKPYLSFTSTIPFPHSPNPRSRSRSIMSSRSSLIDPDGGALVQLVVPAEERAAQREAAGMMPAVRIGRVDLEWVHVVAEGWASPLTGFMREEEYLQCLHFNCLRLGDGSVVNMSVPIVLAVGDEEKERIGGAADVALVGPEGDFVAILRRLGIVDS